MNKTGTTTMLKIFKKLNFRDAPQIKQILDIDENQKIKKFCRRYNFFQDLPFFCKEIYIFNNAKNIFEILIKSDSLRNMYQNIGEKIKLNYKKIIISNKKTNYDRKIELNNCILKKIFTNNFQKNK